MDKNLLMIKPIVMEFIISRPQTCITIPLVSDGDYVINWGQANVIFRQNGINYYMDNRVDNTNIDPGADSPDTSDHRIHMVKNINTTTYTCKGTYCVKIYGLITRLSDWDPNVAKYLHRVIDYGGSPIQKLSFNDAINLISVPDYLPRATTDISLMFYRAKKFNPPGFPSLNFDTSNITNMRSMFSHASIFNQPLHFDTSKVTNMSCMFFRAKKFNQPLHFNTKNTLSMGSMFHGASKFNQCLDSFDTSRVAMMDYMFCGAKKFNQSLDGFDTSLVQDMTGMFSGCTAFNKPLTFNTLNVNEMCYMFDSCTKLNSQIILNTKNVLSMESMFSNCKKFNQKLDFDTTNVRYMDGMFHNCRSFNQLVDFNIKNVLTMADMFTNTISFDQNSDLMKKKQIMLLTEKYER